MPWSPLHPPSKRREVAALMGEGDLSMSEVAAESGVPNATVGRWNRAHGWRPARARTNVVRMVRGWPEARVAAMARVYRVPGVDPADLAQVLGADPQRAQALFAELGLADAAPAPGRERRYRSASSKADLSRRLRAHVARQIAAHDQTLSEGAAGRGGADTSKLLRDLVGLKRLLDDLDAAPARAGRRKDSQEGSQEDDDQDRPIRRSKGREELAAMRASILRRYEAFEKAWEAGEHRPAPPSSAS